MASTSEKSKPSSDGSIRNCPICMDPLLPDAQAAKYLSCAHAFHEPCIDRWLVDKTTCPVCRNQELKPPPIPPPAVRQWHIRPPMMRGVIGATVITTEVLPSAVRPRQQSVHGRRRARRRGAAPSTTGRSRSRSRGARSRSRAPSAAATSSSEPPRTGGNGLV